MKENKFLKYKEIVVILGYSLGFYGLFSDLSIALWVKLILCFIIFFSLLIALNQYKIYQNKQYTFKLLREEKGELSLDDIRNANSIIEVTHFTSSTPTDNYIEEMLQIQKNVIIQRYLPKNFDKEKSNNAWVKKFSVDNHYKEIVTKFEKFPFDIIIIDNNIVKIKLPLTEHDDTNAQTIVFKNADVAKIFSVLLKKLQNVR